MSPAIVGYQIPKCGNLKLVAFLAHSDGDWDRDPANTELGKTAKHTTAACTFGRFVPPSSSFARSIRKTGCLIPLSSLKSLLILIFCPSLLYMQSLNIRYLIGALPGPIGIINCAPDSDSDSDSISFTVSDSDSDRDLVNLEVRIGIGRKANLLATIPDLTT